ncbi:MAG: hypothetical protein ACRYG8_24235 [Janthinobacterium lividum]
MRSLLLACVLLLPAAARAATLDHEKPLFTQKGAPLCPSEPALRVLLEHLHAGRNTVPPDQFGCVPAPEGTPVRILDSDGVIDRWDKVFVSGGDRWVPDWSLRN